MRASAFEFCKKESPGTYCIQAPVVTDTVCRDGRIGTLIEVFGGKLQSCLATDSVDCVVLRAGGGLQLSFDRQLNRALDQDSDTHCIEAVGGHRLRCAWEEELPLVAARATGKGTDPSRAGHVPLQADRCSTRPGINVDGDFRLEVEACDNTEDGSGVAVLGLSTAQLAGGRFLCGADAQQLPAWAKPKLPKWLGSESVQTGCPCVRISKAPSPGSRLVPGRQATRPFRVELRAGEGRRHLLGGGTESAAVLVLAQRHDETLCTTWELFRTKISATMQFASHLMAKSHVYANRKSGQRHASRPNWTVQDANRPQEGAHHELAEKQLSERTALKKDPNQKGPAGLCECHLHHRHSCSHSEHAQRQQTIKTCSRCSGKLRHL